MYKRANRLSLALLLAASSLASTNATSAWGQTPQQAQPTTSWIESDAPLRPVPREGFHVSAAPSASNPQPKGWDLRWRRSRNVPQPSTVSSTATTSTTVDSQLRFKNSGGQAAAAQTTQAVGAPKLQAVNRSPELRRVSGETSVGRVVQAAWLDQTQRNDLRSNPEKNEVPGELTAPANPNFFEDPFGETGTTGSKLIPPESVSQKAIAQGEMQMPTPSNHLQPLAAPELSEPANHLRTTVAQIELPPPAAQKAPESVPPAAPENQSAAPENQSAAPQSAPDTQSDSQLNFPPPAATPKAATTPPKSGASIGKMLREQGPSDVNPKAPAAADKPAPAVPVPAPAVPAPAVPNPPVAPAPSAPTVPPIIPGSPFDNPFEPTDADQTDRDRLNSGAAGQGGRYGSKEDVRERDTFSCEVFRQRIAAQTIDQVSLDISPPYRPDEMDDARYEMLKREFEEKQRIRTWRNISGKPIAKGRLRDLAYQEAVVETENGREEGLPIDQLSEADIAYIAENWGLPKECLIDQVAYKPRRWVPMTMTWTASNLCHNPLYFQDVNLERYGHTHGPVLEPVVQSAHFFANIAVLPYKMGVHCPSECQYALGYYRPGNCAPWITPPVPISVRGAISQAATMTGLFWLIP